MDSGYLIHVVLSSIFFFLYLVFIPLLVIRRKLQPIKSRCFQISIMQMSFAAIDMGLRLSTSGLPCIIVTYDRLMIVPVLLYPYFVQAFSLWLNFYSQEYVVLATAKAGSTSADSSILKLNSMTTNIVKAFHGKRQIFRNQNYQLLFFFLIFFGISLIVGSVVHLRTQEPITCALPYARYVIIIQGVFALFLVLMSFVLLFKVKDAFAIKTEAVYLLLTVTPFYVLFILATNFGWSENIQPSTWMDLVEIVLFGGVILIPFFSTFARKFYILRSGSASHRSVEANDEFFQVLRNKALLESFENFCKKTWTAENLLFIKDCQQYRIYSQESLPAEAKVIVEKYFNKDSVCELNVDSHIREEIFERINASNINHDLFQGAEKQALVLLRYHVFPLWKSSGDYTSVLKELKVDSLADLISLKKSSSNLLGSGSKMEMELAENS